MIRKLALLAVLALAACAPGAVEAETADDMPLRRALCVQIAEAVGRTSQGFVIVPASEPKTKWTLENMDEQIEVFASSSWTTDELSRMASSASVDVNFASRKNDRFVATMRHLRANEFDAARRAFAQRGK